MEVFEISKIEKFVIRKLFGLYDVILDFEENVNIYIGVNGLGKTTVLNCLYYALIQDYEKLLRIDFETIELKISSQQPLTISKKMFEKSFDEKRQYYVFDNISFPKEMDIEDLMNKLDMERDYIRYKRLISELSKKERERLKRYDNSLAEFKGQVLYFPTYRRIEEDMFNLGLDPKTRLPVRENLIKFGMEDVKAKLDELLNEIRDNSINSFNSMTSSLLLQYVDLAGLTGRGGKNKVRLNENKLMIALERSGSGISNDAKKRLISLLKSRKVYEEEYTHLYILLKNLITVYDALEEMDQRIKSFCKVCNSYFFNKTMVYDESKVNCSIRSIEGVKLEFSQLSSGEKQIVSIFSKLYLEDKNQLLVLVDEPELSLSLSWQKKILVDIMESGKCATLIAVTHSPFIFNNKFDDYAIDMMSCFVPVVSNK